MNKMSIAHRASTKDYSHFDLAAPNPSSGKWELDFINITAFFVQRGYFIYRQSVDKWILIRIVDNIVKQVGKKDLKDEILNYIIDQETRYMHQYVLKNIAKAVSDEFLETLPEKNVSFRKDRKDAMQLYYQNCIIKITRDKISRHDYTELDGFIWESQILQREFNENELKDDSDFKKFCWNISNHDKFRYSSILSVIGYLVHNFKSPGYSPAIILNDEVISDHPEGGTGKGILIKAVERFVQTTTLEGKTFSFDNNFVYQQVNSDTKLISFQDVNKSFDFERLFSVMTDGITIEKKGLQAVHYNFNDTPKIIITTNYALRGVGNSHERRRFEIEISQYYNKNRTPFDEFKKMMFDDWDPNDFQLFDNFIIECCQFYLTNGLVKQKLINLPEKRLIAQTNSDFIKFMADFTFSTTAKSVLYSEFTSQYDEYLGQKYFTKQLFTKWVVVYAESKGYKVGDYVYNSIRHYTFEK